MQVRAPCWIPKLPRARLVQRQPDLVGAVFGGLGFDVGLKAWGLGFGLTCKGLGYSG